MTGSGAGSRLPTAVLLLAGVSAVIAVAVSCWSILLQLRNYRKPALQRMVVRIMLMVPLYAIASLISLFSLEAAFFIDAIRDIYEAFVIYCFFVLLLSYLGGERSLLIMLHGRPPKEPLFPINLFKREIDVSDPYTFLFLKRGILQYVQVKPVLAAATLILKALGKYNEGDFRANSGYLYISIIYNISICLALYCLAIFWLCVSEDLTPFRPMPKFLCVKGILFFSFWQSIAISILVAAQIITRLGPYTDAEHVSVGLNDLLICIEMPIFAFAHNYAFSYRDYIDSFHTFVARMPMYYAFRDAFGARDVVEDSKATLRGQGMDYREFEPAEGFMHQGIGRERRIRAGLRYSKGGQRKYWLPKTQEETQPPGRAGRMVNNVIKRVAGDDEAESVHAPLLAQEAENVYHLAPDLQGPEDEPTIWDTGAHSDQPDDGYGLPFGDIDEADEELFAGSRQYLFGDYNYPVIDVSSESARIVIWDEEERVLNDERGAWFSPLRGAKGQAAIQQRSRPAWSGYGAVDDGPNPASVVVTRSKAKSRQIHYDDDDDADTAPVRSSSRQSVVDYETDRSAIPARPNDLGLRWQKSHQHPSSRSHSPHIRSTPPTVKPPPTYLARSGSNSGSAAASSSGSSPSNPHHASSNNLHTRTSNTNTANNSPKLKTTHLRSPPAISMSRSNSSNGKSPVNLPPDAVDLVVEDPHAAEEEHVRERRKGDPAVSGLRKVYRRGFELGDGNDDVSGGGGNGQAGVSMRGEVEVEEPVRGPQGGYLDHRRVEAGERIVDALEERQKQDGSDSPGSPMDYNVVQRETERVVATSGTPPLHAQVRPYHFGGLPDEDNPWA